MHVKCCIRSSVRILALYDIHGNVDALEAVLSDPAARGADEGDRRARWASIVDGVPELRSTSYDAVAAGKRMLVAGWPDEGSVSGALIEPADPLEVTRIFERMGK